jgi:hypothetical protein
MLVEHTMLIGMFDMSEYRGHNVWIELYPNARAMMTRDMELIRRILLKIKERRTLELGPIEIDGPDSEIVTRHLEMLHKQGLIEGVIHYSVASALPDLILVKDMSWDGHDFIGVMENKGVWNIIKEKFSPSELAEMPFSIIKKVGLALWEHLAMKAVGL